MTPLKSLAHPEWPYAGTAHEWRGFVKADKLQPTGQIGPWTIYFDSPKPEYEWQTDTITKS